MDTIKWLQQQAEAIVRRGAEVRTEVAGLMAAVAHDMHHVRDGALGLVRGVLVGAMKGVEEALPTDRGRVLRAVVDGIGDGLAVTAQAASLALKEAAGGAARFARADVDQLVAEMRGLSAGFADTVTDVVTAAAHQSKDQAKTVAEHAIITLQRVVPSFAAALDAARAHPMQLAREAAVAGGGAARGAAGALFTAVGRQLERLGAKLRPKRDAEPPSA